MAMIGSPAWYALMRRNMIYRRRNLFGSLVEMLSPCIFMLILWTIKHAVADADIVIPAFSPGDYDALIPLSYHDYVKAFQAQRVCTTLQDEQLDITGLTNRGFGWQIPFIRCDPRKCQYLGEDAQPYCEYSFLAIAGTNEGGSQRAQDFRKWIYDTWPVLTRTRSRNNTGMPFEFEFVQFFDHPDAMDRYVKQKDYGSVGTPKIGMGIVFDGNSTNDYVYWLRQNSTLMNVPTREIKGRMLARSTPPTNEVFAPYAKSDQETCYRNMNWPKLGPLQNSCTAQYMYNGIIATQRLVDDYILHASGAAANGFTVSDGGVVITPFPQEGYIEDGFFAVFSQFAPLLVALGLFYPFGVITGQITREKQLGQKEMMMIMGAHESDIGGSWFCSLIVFHAPTSLLLTLTSSFLYSESSLLFLWIFWIMVLISVIVLGMLVAACFARTHQALLFGVSVYLGGVLLSIGSSANNMNTHLLQLLSIHPLFAICRGVKLLGFLDDHNGLTRHSMNYAELGSAFNFALVYKSLLTSMIVNAILSWYINRTLRPVVGEGLPWWFPFHPSYWLHRSGTFLSCTTLPDSIEHSADIDRTKVPVEGVDDKQRRNIDVINIGKKFDNRTALDGLSVSFCCGEITSLLGQNGAGKTTLLKIITGSINPSSGSVIIDGVDVKHSLPQIRKAIGVCPQVDCLFPELTVREHLEFYSHVKGPFSLTDIEEALKAVALLEQSETISRELSGGMKRKLSLAIAFCGGSKYVLLDEPTSGMDPLSRRCTWDVIRGYRNGRCVILTTHCMVEADVLSDRIAILAHGQLRCFGSPFYLKSYYGVGYQLKIGKKIQVPIVQSFEHTHTCSCFEESGSTHDSITYIDHSLNLHRTVLKYIPQANLLSNTMTELVFHLPLYSIHDFIKMLRKLDREVGNGKAASYSLSINTLDQVFLKISRGEEPEPAIKRSMESLTKSKGSSVGSQTSFSVSSLILTSPDAHDTSSLDMLVIRNMVETNERALVWAQMKALLRKRLIIFRRDKKTLFCTILFPMLVTVFGFLLSKIFSSAKAPSDLQLALDMFRFGENDLVPVVTNAGIGSFVCQPGLCSTDKTLIENKIVNEAYVMCGYESRLASLQTTRNETCSLQEITNVVSSMPEPVHTVVIDIRNVTEASSSIASPTSLPYFGGIWFSHDGNSTISGSNDYDDEVMKQCDMAASLLDYHESCGRFEGIGYVLQYNFTAIHGMLLIENMATTAISRLGANNPQLNVQTTISPLPVSRLEEVVFQGDQAMIVWLLLLVGFQFISGSFAVFVMNEKSTKTKHLQMISGVDRTAYWITLFIWDIATYQLPLWLVMTMLFAFEVKPFARSDNDILAGVILLLMLHGPAAAGYSYGLTHAFTSANACQLFIVVSGFFIGIGVCFMLRLFASDERVVNADAFNSAASVLTWILRFHPSFCLGRGLFNVLNFQILLDFEYNEASTSALSPPILLYEVVCLLVQGVFYFVGAILLDYIVAIQGLDRFKSSFHKRSLQPKPEYISEVSLDIDVERERTRVLKGKTSPDLIVLKRIRKTFASGIVALDDLTLGIPPGECFGLIGSNGAGKSTTMGLLTSEFRPTEGEATIAGFDVVREASKLRRRIGYCPQVDALFETLTGREHIELYACIKGVPQGAVYGLCEMKLTEVCIPNDYWDVKCNTYSGGLKRRLSLACATIGQPQILLLDECSTGADPVSRREIWQLISNMVERQNSVPEAARTSIVLTTHSMDEAEALCRRIGIMVNGKLQCLGSAQHLKNKFGGGYILEIRAHEVSKTDSDYLAILKHLRSSSSWLVELGEKINPEDPHYDLDQCKFVLSQLSLDLPEMISSGNKNGFVVWEDANSASGVSISTLAAFATIEFRVYSIEQFVENTFEHGFLLERQGGLCSFELTNIDFKLSNVFEQVERKKHALMIQYYSLSQTSLEQVFKMHAGTEAEMVCRATEFVTVVTNEEECPSVHDHRLSRKADIL